MAADFSQLYSQLGLGPECSLEDFRHACRRRIADLHPDRGGATDAASPDATEAEQIPLDELLALYAKAIRFHGQHGRLPGAPPLQAAPILPAQPAPLLVPVFAAEPVADTATETQTASSTAWSMRWPLIVLLLIAAGLIALGTREDDSATGQGEAQTAGVAEPDDSAVPVVDQLELGMDADAVLAIQGAPMRYNDWEWEYGPSWLRFEDGQLVDWYSSPLHPLRTATASPKKTE
jgi:hypothetical protein